MTWLAIKLLLGGWLKRIGNFLVAAFKWCLDHPWQAICAALVLFSAWLWHHDSNIISAKDRIIAAQGRTIEAMKREAEAKNVIYRATEKHLADNAQHITKEKNDAISRINDRLAVALDELRKRPSRSSDPAAPAQVPADGQAVAGATGAQLFSEDAGFLVREAASADTIRESLKACYVQYDDVKAALDALQ